MCLTDVVFATNYNPFYALISGEETVSDQLNFQTLMLKKIPRNIISDSFDLEYHGAIPEPIEEKDDYWGKRGAAIDRENEASEKEEKRKIEEKKIKEEMRKICIETGKYCVPEEGVSPEEDAPEEDDDSPEVAVVPEKDIPDEMEEEEELAPLESSSGAIKLPAIFTLFGVLTAACF